MQRRHQGIGPGGEHAAGLEFAAIGADPALPQPRQPERPARGRCQAMPLLQEGISRNQAAPMPPTAPKRGLLCHGFAAGIERSGARAAIGPGGQGILDPLGHQPPQHQGRCGAAMLVAHDQHRLPRHDQPPRGVMGRESVGQRRRQPRQQLIEGRGE